jgi:hypothetical protein
MTTNYLESPLKLLFSIFFRPLFFATPFYAAFYAGGYDTAEISSLEEQRATK